MARRRLSLTVKVEGPITVKVTGAAVALVLGMSLLVLARYWVLGLWWSWRPVRARWC